LLAFRKKNGDVVEQFLVNKRDKCARNALTEVSESFNILSDIIFEEHDRHDSGINGKEF
jgi:hypothetical protein